MNRPYSELADGTRWYFDEPPTRLGIGTVASALSQIARWGGQAKLVDGFVYTVAQHSIKVSYIEETLTALMHDAHELAVGDMCSPVKQYLRARTDVYTQLDRRSAQAIADIFGTDYPMSPAVKRADLLMGLIESFDLMPNNGADLWWTVGSSDELAVARELYISRPELRPEPWSSEETCSMFVARYLDLKHG